MLKFLLILLLVSAGLGTYYFINQPTDINQPTELPVDRKITDQNGRSVEVTILGLENNQVTFKRLSDNRMFILPVDTLSEKDQEYLSSVTPRKYETKKTIPRNQSASDYHISNMREKIRELEADNGILKMKIGDPSGRFDERDVSVFQKELEENRSKINHLKVKIKEWENR